MFKAHATLLYDQWLGQWPEAPKADKICILKQMDEKLDARLKCELKET